MSPGEKSNFSASRARFIALLLLFFRMNWADNPGGKVVRPWSCTGLTVCDVPDSIL